MDIQATVTSEEGWTRTVKITVPAAEIDSAFETVAKRVRKSAKVPGFRPGKVPMKMINERYADSIRQDVIEEVVPSALEAGLIKLSLNPLGPPNFTSLDKLEKGSEMTFEAEVEIRPDFEVSGYKGLKLTKQVYEVTDKDIDRAVDNLRGEAATTTEVKRAAQEGDVVVCNLQKISDSLNRLKTSDFEGIQIELRADRTRPELLQGVVGMSVGEGKEIEVNYPAEEPDPDLAGNSVRYRVWVKTVSQKNLPAADDEFVKSLNNSKIKTMAKLRDILRDDITRRAEDAAQREMRTQIRKAVVEANPIPVPGTFLNRYLDDMTTRLQAQNPSLTAEAVRGQFEPMATEQFRWDLVLFEIARKEDVKVTEEEVSAILDGWPEGAGEKPDKQKIQSTLLENKVYDSIMTAAEIDERPYEAPSRIIRP